VTKPQLHWQFARFDALTLAEWYAVSRERIDVFIMEQNCPFQDLDGADQQSWHLLGWRDAGSATRDGTTHQPSRELAAYCRIVDAGVKFAHPSIGRVITPQRFRREGFGRLLMAEACARHDALFPRAPNRIGAQARLEKFYQAFGFVTDSAPYIEDGIPHLEMQRAAKESL
jgi:ElaA protein